MKLLKPFIVLAAAAALATGMAMPAFADTTGDTATTFTLDAAGGLSLTVAADAALVDGSSGDASVSGPLDPVGVTDLRGSIAGWTVSAVSSTFNYGAVSVSTGVAYDSGTVTHTGQVTAASSGATVDVTTIGAVVAGTEAVGNNTANFTPTLTVSLPSTALAGDYTGTVTTSVA